MTKPEGSAFGDDAREANVVEQHIPIDVSDEDPWRDAARVTAKRRSEVWKPTKASRSGGDEACNDRYSKSAGAGPERDARL